MIEQRNTILLSDLSVDPALLNADCGNGFRSRQMANFWVLYDMGFWYSFIGNYMELSLSNIGGRTVLYHFTSVVKSFVYMQPGCFEL